MTPRRLERRPALEGLRGIAVLLVLCRHTELAYNSAGVDIFFALSGVLITTVLCQEWDRTGTLALRRFHTRRLRRLLPPLVLLLCATVAIAASGYPYSQYPLGIQLLSTSLFTNNWLSMFTDNWHLQWLAPTWSLGQEMQFYLLWPLALAWMLRRGLSPRRIVLVLACVIVAMLAIETPIADLLGGYSAYYSPLDRGAELLLACAVAIAWRYRLLPSLGSARLGRGLRAGSGWLLVAVLLWLTVHKESEPGYSISSRHVWLLSAPVCVGLVVALIERPYGVLASALAVPALRYLGKISYALFLVHMLCWRLSWHYLPTLSMADHQAITFTSAIALASASWYLLESPVLNARIGPSLPAPFARATVRPPAVEVSR